MGENFVVGLILDGEIVSGTVNGTIDLLLWIEYLNLVVEGMDVE